MGNNQEESAPRFSGSAQGLEGNSSTGWEKANLDPSLASGEPISQKDNSESEEKDDSDIQEAIESVNENKHQNLAKENLGNEPEEKAKGNPESPYKLKDTLDDKRPQDDSIKKGWTVDSNTSRGPQDQKDH